MNVLLSANIFEALGLDWRSILFYLGNFVILLTVVILLLYKPIKKMLAAKRKTISDALDENEKLKTESENEKAEYGRKLEELKVENAKTSAEIAKNAQARADAIVEDAQAQAKTIVEAAKKETLYQKEQLKNEYRDSVNRLAVEIAQKMLEREVSDKDNSELIEQVLSDWEND